jgi:sugar/nucleoside kinase (ribokinase family)
VPTSYPGPKIACVGNFVVDMIARPVETTPAAGELVLVDSITVAGGGAGFASSVALALLGADVRAYGAVGSDLFGAQICRWLDEAGVGTSNIQSVASPTSSTVVLLASSGERSYIHATGASHDLRIDPLLANEPGLAALHIGSALVLPGLEADDAGWELVKRAHERGVLTSLDTSWDSTGRWHRVHRYLPYLDVFCPSLVEAREITGQGSAEAIADWVVDRGTRMVVIHDGARGAYVKSAGFTGWVPAYRVGVVDTTGAGECFDAGLVFGLASGWSVEEAASLACAVGALAATQTGAVGGVTSLGAAKELMDSAGQLDSGE